MKSLIGIFSVFFLIPHALAEDVLNSGFKVDLQYGISQMSGKLEGDGFAGDNKATSGSFMGGHFSYGWVNGLRANFKYGKSTADLDTPTPVTPSKVSADREETSIYLTQNLTGEDKNAVRVGAGYTILNYNVDASTPPILTEQHVHGLTLISEMDYFLNDQWFSTFGFSLFMPNNFNEKDVSSGYNPRYWAGELSVQLNWVVQENFRIYLKGIYRHDQVKFDGTGSRGTTNASDTRTTILLPLGVSYDF